MIRIDCRVGCPVAGNAIAALESICCVWCCDADCLLPMMALPQ